MSTNSTNGPALLVRGLVKRYDDVVAVDGLDLEVHAGECFGLLGPNGAGKTTTIEILEGLNTPDSGEVLVVGWGCTYGAITAAVEEAQMEGKAVASIHIRHLNPLPPDLGQILRQYRRVLVPEINSGQLVRVLRAEYLVDAVGFNRVRGMPLASQEILEAINQLLEAKQ